MKFFLTFLLISSFTAFAKDSTVVEERLYLEFKYNFSEVNYEDNFLSPISTFEQTLLVDAYWDSLQEEITPQKLENLNQTSTFYFGLIERLRLSILKIKYGEMQFLDFNLHENLLNELRKPIVETKLIYILAAHEDLLLSSGHKRVIDLASLHDAYSDIAQENESKSDILSEIVTDLYFNTPDVTTYMGGEYIKSVKIFMFCRQNRLYPCLMVMKDINGIEVRREDGSLWSNPALASAQTGLPSYQRNGNTPAGIFTINSVMPVADQQLSYGKFRRMILNFVPKSKDEVLIKELLPKSSWNHDWWKATLIARDIGRNLFRIHGSGRINPDSSTSYYPFRRTLGCISQRENTYEGVTYRDQRNLLDSVMKAMELPPIYQNEPQVKGILYIVETNDKNSPVTLDELEEFGIR